MGMNLPGVLIELWIREITSQILMGHILRIILTCNIFKELQGDEKG